jgi:hypothetical protein
LLGGLLIAFIQLPLLLWLDAFSFIISAVSLIIIHRSFNESASENTAKIRLRLAIVDGLRYILRNPVLSSMVLLLLLINFILPTANAQLVLLVKQWFSANDTQVGLLYAGSSLGTVIFSLAAHRLGKHLSFGVLMLGALMLEGLLTTVPIITHTYWLLLFCWLLRGGADVVFIVNAYTLTQLTVPNQLLGRVITFTRVLTWSTASVGALLGGFAIEATQNVALVYATVGLLTFVIALAFFVTPLGHAERYMESKPI